VQVVVTPSSRPGMMDAVMLELIEPPEHPEPMVKRMGP